MKKVIIVFALVLVSMNLKAEPAIPEIMEVLKEVETNNRPDVIGDGGASYGILQIKQIAIDDVNHTYGTNFVHEDAFEIEKAERIFKLYIKRWVKHLERVEGRKATNEDVVRIWNGGPNGYKKKSTLIYYNKYKKYSYLCAVDKEFDDHEV